MNWKIILIGGVLFYLAGWLVAPVTIPLIHEGVLADDYAATSQFWRPELMNDNMAALMPRWIVTGLISAFVAAGLYVFVRPALSGAGWMRGLKYGVGLALLSICFMLGWSGVLNLPDSMWGWWALESTLTYLISGAILGWIAERVSPVGAGLTPPSISKPATA